MCLQGGLTRYLNIDLICPEQRLDHTCRRPKQGAQVPQKWLPCPLPVPIWTSGPVGFGENLKRTVTQSDFSLFLSLKRDNKGQPNRRGQTQAATTTADSGPIFNSGGNCESSHTGTFSMHSEGRLGHGLPPQSPTWVVHPCQLLWPPRPLHTYTQQQIKEISIVLLNNGSISKSQ